VNADFQPVFELIIYDFPFNTYGYDRMNGTVRERHYRYLIWL